MKKAITTSKISKSFPGVLANSDVSIEIEEGSIHAIVGENGAGKSTLMKSIGLNIIMAQIGYYVAATDFNYNPYVNLMTRICGMDNIFKGMSSFMVEMMELMAILKRNDCNTLVLGDEICRGTEEKSANIIVSPSDVCCCIAIAAPLSDVPDENNSIAAWFPFEVPAVFLILLAPELKSISIPECHTLDCP